MDNQIVVILGASSKPNRYANKAQRLLMQHGYTVIPVHRLEKEIEGVAVKQSLSSITEAVDTITVYINPAAAKELTQDIIALMPRRIIFNPGTESPELELLMQQKGIEVQRACTLVLLATGQF